MWSEGRGRRNRRSVSEAADELLAYAREREAVIINGPAVSHVESVRVGDVWTVPPAEATKPERPLEWPAICKRLRGMTVAERFLRVSAGTQLGTVDDGCLKILIPPASAEAAVRCQATVLYALQQEFPHAGVTSIAFVKLGDAA